MRWTLRTRTGKVTLSLVMLKNLSMTQPTHLSQFLPQETSALVTEAQKYVKTFFILQIRWVQRTHTHTHIHTQRQEQKCRFEKPREPLILYNKRGWGGLRSGSTPGRQEKGFGDISEGEERLWRNSHGWGDLEAVPSSTSPSPLFPTNNDLRGSSLLLESEFRASHYEEVNLEVNGFCLGCRYCH